MIKEIKQKFKKITVDVNANKNDKWYNVYGFANEKDELILDLQTKTITMTNLEYNGDDVWDVINYLRDNHSWTLA